MEQILIEYDKAGAEWVVSAFLADDPAMLSVVSSGGSPHTKTGMLISGASEKFILHEDKIVGHLTDEREIAEIRKDLVYPSGVFLPRTMSIRQAGKKSNHGLNYGMKFRRFALENEIAESEAKELCCLYHGAYPGIENTFHVSVIEALQRNRTLINCFGRKRVFRDVWGDDLTREAIAFLPQSTVFDLTRIGMTRLSSSPNTVFKDTELLAQVHDSILCQDTVEDWPRLAAAIYIIAEDFLNAEMTYNRKTFRIGTDVKVGISWGNMRPITVSSDIEKTVDSLRKTWEELHESSSGV